MAILDHCSHSQISMWQRCPKQWEYRYVKGLKMPPSGPLVEGKCYHKALEGNFKQKITTKEDLPVEACLDLFSDTWVETLAEEEYVDWGKLDPGSVKDEGVSLVQEYMTSTSPSVQPIEVEEAHMSEVANIPFVCIVDLVDTMKMVVDHKTSGKSYTQDDVDRDIQAGAAAFALGRPIIYQNHIALKQRVPRIQIVETARLRADIDWWVDMATGVVIQMKSGIAPARPTGWHCSPRFCGFYEMCRGELVRSYF